MQNVAASSYHALQFTLQRTRGSLTGGISYSYSHSIDNSSDRSDPILVNSYNLAENRASSSFDERHLLNINYIYQFSLKNIPRRFSDWANARESQDGVSTSKCCSTFVDGLLDGWEFSGITLFQSGTPFTVEVLLRLRVAQRLTVEVRVEEISTVLGGPDHESPVDEQLDFDGHCQRQPT